MILRRFYIYNNMNNSTKFGETCQTDTKMITLLSRALIVGNDLFKGAKSRSQSVTFILIGDLALYAFNFIYPPQLIWCSTQKDI